MTAKRKLPRFQIHLSTMIILSFLAGGLIYVDILYYRMEVERASKRDSEMPRPSSYRRAYIRNETVRLVLLEISGLIFFVLGVEAIIRRREARKP